MKSPRLLLQQLRAAFRDLRQDDFPFVRRRLPSSAFALQGDPSSDDPSPLRKLHTFPLIDRSYARRALEVCLWAEMYEKEEGYRIFPNKEERHKVRQAVWDRFRIPPTYFERDTEIEIDET